MFRRIVNATRSFLRNSPSPPVQNVQRPPSAPSSVVNQADAPLFDPVKKAAYHELKDAVKELSLGAAQPFVTPPKESLKAWNETPPEQLKREQLEELARAYFEGVGGLPQDRSKSVALWAIASGMGSIEGRYSRASCLRDGEGPSRNSKHWLHKTTTIRHYSLAIMLENGEGCEKDEVRAFQHYRAAAKGGIVPAFHNIGNAYAYGRGVEQSDHKASLYYQAGVELGDPASCFVLGTWYYRGRGNLPVDPKKAFDLQLQAAQAKHPGAMFNVGVALLTGDGVSADPPKAAEWFEQAAALHVSGAALNLSKMYMEGKGVPRDLQKARSLILPLVGQNEIAKQLLEEIDRLIALER
eukprot:gene35-36_t